MSNEQRSSACPSCGVEWANHLGIVGTCAENKRLRDRLRHAERLLKIDYSCAHCLHDTETMRIRDLRIEYLEAARQEDAR